MAAAPSVGPRLIRVDLQEYIADAQRHALRMRDNDFALPHVLDHRPGTDRAENIEHGPAGTVSVSRGR
jgi:hypothetical protein